MILEIVISDIDFYISSMNVVVVIIISLTRLNFYNFIFSIAKNALIKIIKKTSFCLYSNNVLNFSL